MGKILKKIAAVGAAVMMMGTMTVGASAIESNNIIPTVSSFNDEGIMPYSSTSFRFYYLKDSSFTKITGSDLGQTSSSGKVSLNIYIGHISSNCKITFAIKVNGVQCGSGTVSSTGNHPYTFYNSDIPKGGNITVSATFHYNNYNDEASGSFIAS